MAHARVFLVTALLACSRSSSRSGESVPSASVAAPRPATPEIAFWSPTAHVDRVRDFAVPAEGLDTRVSLGSGREEWRLLVTCRSGKHPCAPFAAVTLELEFARVDPPDVALSLRHALRGYEDGTNVDFAVRFSSSGCEEANFTEPPKTCTFPIHSGWTCDDLARKGGRPNPDEGPDEGRPRSFVARIENHGAPIAVHVRVRAEAHRD